MVRFFAYAVIVLLESIKNARLQVFISLADIINSVVSTETPCSLINLLFLISHDTRYQH